MKKINILLPMMLAPILANTITLSACSPSPQPQQKTYAVVLYSPYGGFNNEKTSILLSNIKKDTKLSDIPGYEEPQIIDSRFENYEFITWLDSDGNEYNEETKVTKDIFITAKFGEVVKTPQNYKTDNWATVMSVCNQGFVSFANTYCDATAETESEAKESIINWIKQDNCTRSSKDVAIMIGDEVIHSSLRIIGVDHDTLADDSSKNAFFTFEFEDVIDMCLFDTGVYAWYYETKDTNAYLQRYLNKYEINYLPDSIYQNIVPITKTTWVGKTGFDPTAGKYVTTTEKLFPLSMKELGFTISTQDSYIVKEEGSIYELFESHQRTDDYELIQKRYYAGGDTKVNYWTRSGYVEPRTDVMGTIINANYVTNLGRALSLSVPLGCGVAPAFCVGIPQ